MAMAYLDKVLRGRLGFIGALALGLPAAIYLGNAWGWSLQGQLLLIIMMMAAAYWVIWWLYSIWVSADDQEEEEFEVIRCRACGYMITEPPRGDSCPSCDVPLS